LSEFKNNDSRAEMRKLFNLYIVIYFLTPSLLIYLAIFTGITIPYYMDLIPVMLVFWCNNFSRKIKIQDLLFLFLLVICILFVVRNLGDYSWINNGEARTFILIVANYFIFRILVKNEWADSISMTVLKLFKFSMYFMLLEFILINISDFHTILEADYLSAYPQRERLYENIMFLTKPFGLYPGTHNAAIAATISILFLLVTKSISENKAFFIASVSVFFICFSLTAGLVFLLIYMLLRIRIRLSIYSCTVNIFYLLLFGMMICLGIVYYSEITQFRSSAEVSSQAKIAFSDAEYLLSINNSFKVLSHSPFGVKVKDIDDFLNEVYLSRAAQYYGVLLLIFWITAVILVLRNFKYQDRGSKFFSISFLTLFFSSFHYPSIISYPLSILVPLAFIFFKRHPVNIARRQISRTSIIKDKQQQLKKSFRQRGDEIDLTAIPGPMGSL
jgi:hypothetical protein